MRDTFDFIIIRDTLRCDSEVPAVVWCRFFVRLEFLNTLEVEYSIFWAIVVWIHGSN
jgi:hypothetical protein